MSAVTFEEASGKPNGFVFFDGYEDGIRYRVLKGPASVNAYIGVPTDHPLAGFHYDDFPLDVHGGLTYSGEMKDAPGWYWYGWDYAHLGDRPFYDLDPKLTGALHGVHRDSHGWTPAEVQEQAKTATWDFKKYATLAERIFAKR